MLRREGHIYTLSPYDLEKGLNTTAYMKKTFRMFGGDSTTVEIRFSNDLINVIMDRFGEEAMIMPVDEGYFKLIAEVNAGEGFLSWVLQFGEKAELLYPEELKGKIVEKIKGLTELYGVK